MRGIWHVRRSGQRLLPVRTEEKMMEEYNELAFEAQYYLNLALKRQQQARELLDESSKYMHLARETRARAKEVAL